MAKSARSKKQNDPLVGILAGSSSDLERVNLASTVLDELGIAHEVKVLSAHRTPDLVYKYASAAKERGIEVLIACAGLANHLAGAVAAHTLLPVIGVPLASGTLGGVDALLSTVQMPPGVPVASVGIDATKNAAYLAARILALKYTEIGDRLAADRADRRKRYEVSSR
jgi:5-(carboxyamino)imidazole ribonucleotide mutase